MIAEFTVEKSTESSKGGFINKLVMLAVVSTKVFGVTKTQEVKQTVYLKTDEKLKAGKKDKINLDEWTVIERPFTTPDGTVVNLKWLSIKSAVQHRIAVDVPAKATVVASAVNF